MTLEEAVPVCYIDVINQSGLNDDQDDTLTLVQQTCSGPDTVKTILVIIKSLLTELTWSRDVDKSSTKHLKL